MPPDRTRTLPVLLERRLGSAAHLETSDPDHRRNEARAVSSSGIGCAPRLRVAPIQSNSRGEPIRSGSSERVTVSPSTSKLEMYVWIPPAAKLLSAPSQCAAPGWHRGCVMVVHQRTMTLYSGPPRVLSVSRSQFAP